ncbi:MAG: nuclease-related domain-containing protein [Rhodanobacteraceae bacterium]
MIIKEMDDRSTELAALERLVSESSADAAKQAKKELAVRRAGIKGERESAYQIDFHFAKTRNWFVIHDLRLEQDGRTAQIDHLLLSRALDCYVLESKHFMSGLKITDEGEFLRWNKYKRTYEGMASPLAQNERHVLVLRDVFKAMDMPTRLGLRLMPRIFPYVLVSPESRIDRSSKFDSSAVIKADGIRKQFEENLEAEKTLESMMSVARFVSSETARDIAERLAALHRPVAWPAATQQQHADMYSGNGNAIKTPTVTVTAMPLRQGVAESPPQPVVAGPACKKCEGNEGDILHGKYGYYFKCATCQANTAIKFTCQPGHKPRLRKSLQEFYRDCADCGTSQLYFVNT